MNAQELQEFIKQNHTSLCCTLESYINNEGEEAEYLKLSGFPGNEKLCLYIEDPIDFERTVAYLDKGLCIHRDYNAFFMDNAIHYLLRPLNAFARNKLKTELENRDFRVRLSYRTNALEATLYSYPGEASQLFANSNANYPDINSGKLELQVEGYEFSTTSQFSEDCQEILNSILFDVTYNYGITLEPIKFETATSSSPFKIVRNNPLPEQPSVFTFKKYIPELIEYYRTAVRTEHLPFKYLCYFHTIEFFSDTSAYQEASNQVRNLILKPDFHQNIDIYVQQAVRVFKKESEKYLKDKQKISRVLKQFIERSEFSERLTQSGALEYFKSSTQFDCTKPLVLQPVDFSQDSQFYVTLTNRIYSMRCSVVHSNPEFDDEKAVPFVPTTANLDKLMKEAYLIHKITLSIIAKSAQ